MALLRRLLHHQSLLLSRVTVANCRNIQTARQTAGQYYEQRKQPNWWRRQDFDDKMTYVVNFPLSSSLSQVTVLAMGSVYLVWNTTHIYRGPEPVYID